MSPAIVHLRLHPDSYLRPLRSHFIIEKNRHRCNLPFPLPSTIITIHHHHHHNYSSLFLYFYLLLLSATTVAIIGRVDFVLVPPFPHQAALWTEPEKKKALLSLFTTVFPCLNYIYLEGQRICEADTFAHPKASEFAFCSTSEARTRLVPNEERTGRTSNGFSSVTLMAKTLNTF